MEAKISKYKFQIKLVDAKQTWEKNEDYEITRRARSYWRIIISIVSEEG